MSATTPEAKIKQKIKKVLDNYRNDGIYYHMPVPGGYGTSTLDYLGFFRGRGFAIEAKRPGGKPTDRQRGTIEAIERAEAAVFVVSDDVSLTKLDAWLFSIQRGTVQQDASGKAYAASAP